METNLQIPSTNPFFPMFTTLGASLFVPEQCTNPKIIAVLAHGHAGHRDYCYQKLLSRILPMASIRFDFSGCGVQLGAGTIKGEESAGVPRVLESDDHDLNTIIQFVRDMGYFVTALIGHSRGAVACLNYAKKDHSILTVVNCSGRYRGHLIHEKIRKNPHLRPDSIGYWEKHRAGTDGALVDRFTLLSEIDSVGAQEMQDIGEELSHNISLLVVFGSKDNVVPVEDASLFLNDLKERATLHLINDADHNFFVQPVGPGTLKVNKNQEVAEIISAYLSPESTSLRLLLRNNKVPAIEGVQNFRPIGGHGELALGHLFRSGNLSKVSPSGSKTLSSIIHTIVDLRSDQEIQLYGASDIPGIQTVRLPPFKSVDYSPAGLSKFFGPAESESGTSEKANEQAIEKMVKASTSILKHCIALFPTLFDLILQNDSATFSSSSSSHANHVENDNDNLSRGRKGILIHCTAGKDRTGVIAAVLLKLCGVPDEIIAMDYELTKYAHVETLSDSSTESSKNSIGHRCDAEIMRRTLRVIDDSFGGIHPYLERSVSPEKIEQVRRVLAASITHDSRSKL